MTKILKKFEEGKRYRFSRDLYLSKPVSAEGYKNSPIRRGWVDECDGKEVEPLSEIKGKIESYLINAAWCEEI